MKRLKSSKYAAKFAETAAEVEGAQLLRHRAFFQESRSAIADTDKFDARCRHILITHRRTGELVATFRMLALASGAEIQRTYSAQYYALEALADFKAPMIELGRFCVKPGLVDPDVLRVAWGFITSYVDAKGAEMLFGCSSFPGTTETEYADAFALLNERHLAPRQWWPKKKAPNIFRFAKRLKRVPDRARALRTMPPLLRSYLKMGGWVSDHAVIDREMNTLHVFTALEVGRIPIARKRALRAVAC